MNGGFLAMIATIGYIVPEYYKFPGMLSPSGGVSFADVPNGLAALSKVPALGWVQIVFFTGIIEGCFGFDDYKSGTPGEYGWTVITSPDPTEKSKKLAAEIANGRLAMVSIIGMFFQDGLTGSAWGDWALYTDSPLRAKTARNFYGGGGPSYAPVFDPATELGVQEPLGFWDPLGFTADGDEAAFKRRRSVEIKHGRICMAATIGYIVPEYYKLPGFISPSSQLQFSDIPNGLAALQKLPTEGWAQIGVFVAFLELFPLRQEADRLPGDYKGCGRLGLPWFFVAGKEGSVVDVQKNERSLNAEINNGRLAMVAIVGLVTQNAVFGTDGPSSLWNM